ncbi:MAG: GAF domain-containing protein, partial [Chloroflexota bacterium]
MAADGVVAPAELEARIAELERELRIQRALVRIAEAAAAAEDLPAFYAEVHETLQGLTHARNCYIALYDDLRGAINFPYYVDEVDTDLPDPRAWEPFGVGEARGSTAYVLRTGVPQHLDKDRHDQLVRTGLFDAVGTLSIEWLGVPLVVEGRTIGVLAVQSYREEELYSDDDVELVVFVARHVAAALARARTIAAIRQRNVELALIDQIGQGLVRHLDFASIIELVGEGIREAYAATSMFVALYDSTTNVISFPYELDDGKRVVASEPFPLGPGLTSTVIRERRPLRIGTQDEAADAGAIIIGGRLSSSWLGVPILAGDDVLGVIGLESYERHKFNEDMERLLAALASSLAVALSNARLFDETKRLLADTNQRAAELSVINEIGEALGKQLDFNAIIQLVGDRVREQFGVEVMGIAIHDPSTDLISFPYAIDAGNRFQPEPITLGEGLSSKVIQSRRPLRFGTDAAARAAGAIADDDADTQSWLGVPITGSNRVIGVLALEARQPNAFNESDERVLATLASSMGVALENARLFDETKRLLADTNQRAAELGVINEIGEALAKQLDFAAIIQLVGDRVRSLFSADSMAIALHDPATNMLSWPYDLDEGVVFHRDSLPLGPGMTSRVLSSGRPVRVGTMAEQEAAGAIQIGGTETLSWLGVPITGANRVIGVLSLESPRENVYSEADERVLATLASSMGVALENARLFDETKRLFKEADERAAELAIINEVQQGLAAQIDMQAMYDLVGERLREIFDAQVLDLGIVDRDDGLIHFPYTIERGVRFPDEPIELFGARRHVMQTREPLLINEHATERDIEMGGKGVLVGEPAKSTLWAPLVVGGESTGVISLQNLDREFAFTDGDKRLLTTLASSLSVALENARLIDTTKRLLTEADERAAELAIINEVQQGL